MTPQRGKETIATHILTNISKSEGNQVMKFSQLIENNLSNIFLEKSCPNNVDKTISRP